MKKIIATPLIAALALTVGISAQAQTTSKTQVKTDTSVSDGVATRTTKVEHVTRRKTHRPKKILGVKIGRKTVTHKTVHTTSTSSNGDQSTTVKTN
ncbi:hypothetical protein [Sphingomonas bacterium]|uniref:hypothetical protein n=1 Tax=Sphingomonas bacterium TaxID=1895847 RepID=UPI001574FD47|nr:hypothetical protein [Sphingomonas bacterium]